MRASSLSVAASALESAAARDDDASADAGIGLGLAVAKGFIEAMEGQLLAEETPGGGLTMAIRLPLYMGSADLKDIE